MRRYVEMMRSMAVLEGVSTNGRAVDDRDTRGIVVLIDMVKDVRGVK